MIIAIIGATGATGKICLQLLLRHAEVHQVISIGRNSTRLNHIKLMELPFQHQELSSINKVDAFISCIGTTMGKAKTRTAFRKVDLELPVQIANLLRNRGCHTAVVLSALGANASSSFFYAAVKGQMEEGITSVGFNSVSIFRPSFIEVDRKDERTGERWMIGLLKLVSIFMIGPLKKLKPQNANILAGAMMTAVLQQKKGIYFYTSPFKDDFSQEHVPIELS